MARLTVGNLIGTARPHSGAWSVPAPAASRRGVMVGRSPQPAKPGAPAAASCCGSGCAGCPYFWGTLPASG